MIRIINYSTGTSIKEVNYPKNSLLFHIEGDNIVISSKNKNVFINSPYKDFTNSANQSYPTAQAVIDDLKENYTQTSVNIDGDLIAEVDNIEEYLLDQITQLQSILTELDTLNATDFATETTLGLVKSTLDNIQIATESIEAYVLSISGTDFATLTEQQAQTALLQTIDQTVTNIQAAVEQIAIDTTSISNDVFDINTKLNRLDDIYNEVESVGTTPTYTTVAASVTPVTLSASNSTIVQRIIRNDSTKRLWISFVSPATSSVPRYLDKDESYIIKSWRGAIYGIWDTGATGFAYIERLTN